MIKMKYRVLRILFLVFAGKQEHGLKIVLKSNNVKYVLKSLNPDALSDVLLEMLLQSLLLGMSPSLPRGCATLVGSHGTRMSAGRRRLREAQGIHHPSPQLTEVLPCV